MSTNNNPGETLAPSQKELDAKLKNPSKTRRALRLVLLLIAISCIATGIWSNANQYVRSSFLIMGGLVLIILFWKRAWVPKKLLPKFQHLNAGKSPVKIFSLKTLSGWVVVFAALFCLYAIAKLIWPTFSVATLNWILLLKCFGVAGILVAIVLLVKYFLSKKTSSQTSRPAKFRIPRWVLVSVPIAAIIIALIWFGPTVFSKLWTIDSAEQIRKNANAVKKQNEKLKADIAAEQQKKELECGAKEYFNAQALNNQKLKDQLEALQSGKDNNGCNVQLIDLSEDGTAKISGANNTEVEFIDLSDQ